LIAQGEVRWRTVHFNREWTTCAAVAAKLRNIANGLRYDFRRADQLRSLAAGFERFAERLEQEALADKSRKGRS